MMLNFAQSYDPVLITSADPSLTPGFVRSLDLPLYASQVAANWFVYHYKVASYLSLTLPGISPVMLVGIIAARSHIKSYWAPTDGKNSTRVPLPKMQDYNEAECRTENLLQVLEYLEYSWVLTSFVHGMIGK